MGCAPVVRCVPGSLGKVRAHKKLMRILNLPSLNPSEPCLSKRTASCVDAVCTKRHGALREKTRRWMDSSRSVRHSSRSFRQKSTSSCKHVPGSLGKARARQIPTSFPPRSIETCAGVKFQCTVSAVNAAAATVTLIPHERMSPKGVAASVALQVSSPTKSPMPVSPQQA